MNARVVALGGEEHRAIELLLPWYVNGSLEPDETAEVEAHLHACATCQTELAWQHRLCAAAPPDADRCVDDGWSALQHRLSAEQVEAAEAAHRTAPSTAAAPAAPARAPRGRLRLPA
ncbi:MAG: zf-HC2 domain-containing protein, partial [Caldimonas sp.]